MLDEARRRRERGQDIVIAAIQPKRDDDIDRILEHLEVIPLFESEGRFALNMDAILARHPQICLIDGLAYDNPPGLRREKRWQDVEDLLEAGISVITSLNLQHIEEKRELVERITGKRVTQSVPRRFLSLADEVVVVDVPPELLLQRKRQQADGKFLGDDQLRILSELREQALVMAADVVDDQLNSYLDNNGVESGWGTQERIMVCLTPRASAIPMLEAGRLTANRFHGELMAAYVQQPKLTPADEEALRHHLEVARAQGARVEVLRGEDPVEALLHYARSQRVTQLFVGHSMSESWWTKLRGSALDRLIRAAEGIDVRIFPH